MFRWIESGRRPIDTNWQPNEPNNVGNDEHCVILHQNGQWNDAPCRQEFHFLCEIKFDSKKNTESTTPSVYGIFTSDVCNLGFVVLLSLSLYVFVNIYLRIYFR